ncbi:MAG: Glycosyl transferases group 1 [Verrucomicrobia bacterium ADurb.Bin006]|nr:MAG: Glycosyl transferases group 1 [Verrucomicrobia bacterium ADurb.Bin006]
MMEPTRGQCGMRVLIVGFAVPDAEMDELRRRHGEAPVQTHKLCWNVVNAMEAAPDVRVDLISSLPLPTYPRCRQLWVGYRRWDRGQGSWNVMVPFINVLLVKHLTRWLASCLLVLRWLIARDRSCPGIVLLYGIHSAHMYAAMPLARLFGVKCVTLVSDPPGVEYRWEGRATRYAKRFDKILLRTAMRASDGLVVLAERLGKDFAPKVPALLMEGIVSPRDQEQFLRASRVTDDGSPVASADFVIMYAGGLLRSYGVGLLLRAFESLPDHCRLWIFGSGEMREEIQAAAAVDARIVYWGFVSNAEVVRRFQEASVLVNPRPSTNDFTLYSFPSKVLEYMGSARPVVSTRLAGIPEEYFQHIIPLDEETPEGLASLLTTLSKMPKEELDSIGQRSQEFVLRSKSIEVQGSRLREFLQRVIGGGTPVTRA